MLGREVHRVTWCASQSSFVEADIFIENLKRFKSMLVKSKQLFESGTECYIPRHTGFGIIFRIRKNFYAVRGTYSLWKGR
jgi:hypothetical protein